MTLRDWLDGQGHGGLRRLAQSAHAFEADVCAWAKQTKPCPAHRAVAIERATRGEVSVEELRPDLTWVRVVDDAWPDGKPVLDVETEAARQAA